MAIIRLANRSRSNRMFYDNLIKEIAICINVGDVKINRDIELFSYRGLQRRRREDAFGISKTEAVGFDTPAGMLPVSVLDSIDLMLSSAKAAGLSHCNSRSVISNFIKMMTDLNDCHLCALNDMMSLK